MILAAAGLAISLPIAFATSKFVQSFLFGMKANDPKALVQAVVILLVAALLADASRPEGHLTIDPVAAFGMSNSGSGSMISFLTAFHAN